MKLLAAELNKGGQVTGSWQTSALRDMSMELAKLQSSARDLGRWQKAQQHLVGERYTLALTDYRELVKRFPGVEQLWFELGLAATGELEFSLAQEAFSKAQQIAPNDVSLLVLIGQQFHRLRKPDQARASFEKAAQGAPESLHAQLSLAAWYEREHRLDDAWTAVEAGLARHPNDAQALCVKALLLHRFRRNTEAEPLLRELVRRDSRDPNVVVSSRHLLGTVLDQLGQYQEALQWLNASKTALRQTADISKMERDYDRAARDRRTLLAELKPAMLQKWKSEPISPALPCPLVLLGGHPRSGTTLLEQILGTHPKIAAFDESEAFAQEIWHRLAPMPSPKALTLRELDMLTVPQRSRMRQRYLRSLLRDFEGTPAGRVFVDKNPSPTSALALWLRVLPEVKVLIALRDPRDVVISCFFQNLMLTPANANFLSLERTARHYADLMDVWLRMRELGGFEWLESRYEDLVAATEREGQRVTEFCGLSWESTQAKHHQSAGRKVLFAPTFSDVAQPIHQRAVGRWQNYRDALRPIESHLAKYCNAFHYAV